MVESKANLKGRDTNARHEFATLGRMPTGSLGA